MADSLSFDRYQFDGIRPKGHVDGHFNFQRTSGEDSLASEFQNKSISTFRSVGRSRIYVPEFTANHSLFRMAIVQLAISHAEWERLGHAKHEGQEASVKKAGSYKALIAAVGYLAWRMFWHGPEIAAELNLTLNQVTCILRNLKKAAKYLGYPTTRIPMKVAVSNEDILALWKQGLRPLQIAEDLNTSANVVRDRLKCLRIFDDARRRNGSRWRDQYGRTYPQMVDGVLSLWRQGMPIKQIESFLSTTQYMVMSILKQQGEFVARRFSTGKGKFKGKFRCVQQSTI